MPSVSILVPVFNAQESLDESLKSLSNQTLVDIEIVCLNDGSTDQSLAVINSHAARDARVRVVDKANTGYGHTLNLGIALARGSYIGILEADDTAAQNAFATLHEMARVHDLDVARCNFYRHSVTTGAVREKKLPGIPLDTVLVPLEHPRTFCQQPSVWANLYKRSFLREHGIAFRETPGASYQDVSFSFKVFICAKRFMMTARPLFYYRIDNSGSSVKSKGNVFNVCGEFAEVERFAREKNVPARFWPHAVRAKYISYNWNMRRLRGKARRLFLRQATREFRRHLLKGQILPWLYKKRQVKRLFLCIFLPGVIRRERT